MAEAKEWFEIDNETFSNLEQATEAARSYAGASDRAVDIYRVTAVPVRCVKRQVSITETDLPVALGGSGLGGAAAPA